MSVHPTPKPSHSTNSSALFRHHNHTKISGPSANHVAPSTSRTFLCSMWVSLFSLGHFGAKNDRRPTDTYAMDDLDATVLLKYLQVLGANVHVIRDGQNEYVTIALPPPNETHRVFINATGITIRKSRSRWVSVGAETLQ